MLRESRALARIAVLSLLIDRGNQALGKLQVGLEAPSLADYIARMSGMDVAAATATAKATLAAGVSQREFHEKNKQCMTYETSLVHHTLTMQQQQ